MKDNKYYVIATNWEGASDEELFEWIKNIEYDTVYTSKEDAFNEAQRIRDEELADDEYVYIAFNDKVWEE